MVTTLYEYYSGQGKALPKTAQERFADPAFATAAKSAGYTPESYQVNMGNAEANTKILGYLNKTGTQAVPTTLSNVSVMEKVPSIVTKTNQLTDIGVRTDPTTGVATLANGTAYNKPDTTMYDTSEEDKAIQANLDEMKSQTDSATASLIANIQQKFAQRRAEQKDINERQKKGIQSALLMGGTTGQGSSAQFAPISSEGIIGAQESYGIKQIAELDAQEQDLIAEAKYAQQTQNFKLLEKKNEQIEKKREEKIALAKKMNEDILEQNKIIREKNLQSSRDSAIADLYSQGVTSPAEMINYLNYDQTGKKIGDFTLKDVTESLKSLVPAGLDDLVKTLRQNGAPASVIQKVLSSGNINQAYESAGSWGAGGTGIIAEYNLYKAQAESQGKTPMDFNSYQNVDANRKIKIAAAANATGMTPAMTSTALKLSDDYEARSKDYYQQREAYNRIISSSTDPSAAGDLALIFNYMKVLDPGSTVREGEFANAQNSGSAFNIVGAKYNKVVKGERLTEAQRKDFVDRASKLFNGAKTQQDSVVKEFQSKATKYGVPPELVVRDTSATGSKASDAIKNEEESKNLVIAQGKKNPAIQTQVRSILQAHPEYTYTDILQILTP